MMDGRWLRSCNDAVRQSLVYAASFSSVKRRPSQRAGRFSDQAGWHALLWLDTNHAVCAAAVSRPFGVHRFCDCQRLSGPGRVHRTGLKQSYAVQVSQTSKARAEDRTVSAMTSRSTRGAKSFGKPVFPVGLRLIRPAVVCVAYSPVQEGQYKFIPSRCER